MISRASHERGAVSLELAVLAPALLLILTVVIVAGRVTVTTADVEQAAASAARSASLARDPSTARAHAISAVEDAITASGRSCVEATTLVDTDGFARRVGQPAAVTVTVTCDIALSDLAMPGLPGSRTITARATSPIDTFRATR